MSAKTDTFRAAMMRGSLLPETKEPLPYWHPYDATRKVPCNRCGKMVKLEGGKTEEHFATYTTVICN